MSLGKREGRIIITSTPLFAKQVSSKLAYGSAREVQRDLAENHSRLVAVSYIQRLCEAVASIIEAKEESWNYVPPKMDALINSVAIGLDGTCMLLCDTGWREAMVGTVSLYDAEGQRQHTIYIGATPEYGKAIFLEREEARNPAHQSPLSPSDLYWHCRRGSLKLAISHPSYQRAGSKVSIMPLDILVLWSWRCSLKT